MQPLPDEGWFWLLGAALGWVCGYMAHKEKIDEERKKDYKGDPNWKGVGKLFS